MDQQSVLTRLSLPRSRSFLTGQRTHNQWLKVLNRWLSGSVLSVEAWDQALQLTRKREELKLDWTIITHIR